MNMLRSSLLTIDDFMTGGDTETRLLYMLELFKDFRTEETYYALELAYNDFKPYSVAGAAISDLLFNELDLYRRGEKRVW